MSADGRTAAQGFHAPLSAPPDARPSLPVVIAGDLALDSLRCRDGPELAGHFEGLCSAMKARFQAHPLTPQGAEAACRASADGGRYVLRQQGRIVGYFVLDPRASGDEIRRYLRRLILLEPGRDFMFAPSVIDSPQAQDIASRAMPHLIFLALGLGARSLVLQGGVHATDTTAMAFYERWGFVRHGGYQSDVFRHDLRLVLDRSGGHGPADPDLSGGSTADVRIGPGAA